MRLAVFTNHFPGLVNTFFARDMRGLLESGIEIDIFSIYPLEPALWRYVPNILDENVLPRSKVHHLSLAQCLGLVKSLPLRKFRTFMRDASPIVSSAAGARITPLAKSIYVLLKGLSWAQKLPNTYDHILAYWGNYAATCAFVYHRLTAPQIPFSIFFHAGIDLYRSQASMSEKLLYADNIITCSEFNVKFMSNSFPNLFYMVSEKIYVHHHGLQFAEFPYEPYLRPSAKIVAVGRLEKEKGFEYLLYAMHELQCKGINIEVEFVGDGKKADFLRHLATKLKVKERVKFRGWLTFDEVRTAMRQATILVHPSPDIGDGVPNVIKEAMALGTPVIASSVAGIPELFDNAKCGVLVPPKDVKALANAIEMLLANDSLRQNYADAARKFVERKFDLWRNGQHFANLLCSTTRPKRLRLTGR